MSDSVGSDFASGILSPAGCGSDLDATLRKVVEPIVNCIGITKRKPKRTNFQKN